MIVKILVITVLNLIFSFIFHKVYELTGSTSVLYIGGGFAGALSMGILNFKFEGDN